MSFIFGSPSIAKHNPSSSPLSPSSSPSPSPSARLPSFIPPTSIFSFELEYFDSQASLTRPYQLSFFCADGSIELCDLRTRRLFLKRCVVPSVGLWDLYVGAVISVYSRQMKVIRPLDEVTKRAMDQMHGRALCAVTAAAWGRCGQLLAAIEGEGARLARMKSCLLGEKQARALLEGGGKKGQEGGLEALLSGPVLLVEVVGPGARQAVEKAGGGSGDVMVIEGPAGSEGALDSLFSSSPSSALLDPNNTAICLIKPHLVQANGAGAVIAALQSVTEGFSPSSPPSSLSSPFPSSPPSSPPLFHLTALQSFQLDRQAAEEYMEVYKRVLPEYHGLVEQLASGTCIAVEVALRKEGGERKGEEGADGTVNPCVGALRAVVGPSDPEIARQLRPNTLRARWGINKIKNGVHCTDLEEDGILESEFFFHVMQRAQ